MAEALEDVGQDVRLEQRPAHRTEPRLRRASPAAEPRRQPGIQKVQLGALRHPPGSVGEEGRQQLDEECVFEHAEPVLDGGGGHVGVARKVVVVDDLSRAQRAELDEGLELPALLDPQQLSDVSLDVGLHVRREVQIPSGVVFDSVEPGESGFEQPSEVVVGRRSSRQPLLLVRETQQIEDRDPAGEGFRDSFHYLEVLGAGQPNRTGREIAGVDELLDGTQ